MTVVEIISGAMGCFAVGWCLGRFVKAIRQFSDQI